jgi:hypothetical protein
MTLATPYEFSIGATLGGIQTLAALGVIWPRPDFVKFAETRDLGSGGVQGYGAPRDTWRWDFIYRAQYDIMVAYATGGITTPLFIRTKDDQDAWHNYSTDMIFLPNMQWVVTRGIKFQLEFRNLVQQ